MAIQQFTDRLADHRLQNTVSLYVWGQYCPPPPPPPPGLARWNSIMEEPHVS